MQKINKRLLGAIAAISIIFMTAAPAAAHGMDSSTDTGTSADGSTSMGMSASTSHEVESLRAQANQLLAQDRRSGHEHTQAQRQNFCEQHQTAINAKVNGLGTEAEKKLTTMNTIFTEVQAYQTKNQLSVSNYDSLVAAATTAQTNASTAISAFKALDTTIDCSSSTVATTLASIKAAADNARTSLKAYRLALHNLIVALKDASVNSANSTNASSTTNAGNTGSQQ